MKIFISLLLTFLLAACGGREFVRPQNESLSLGSTTYDKVKQIKKGDGKSKVIGLLGKPGGESIYPVASQKGNSILRYSFMDTYRVPFLPTPRITRKVLTISFDSNDSVIDISSVESKPE